MNVRACLLPVFVASVLALPCSVGALVQSDSKSSDVAQVEHLGGQFGLFNTAGGGMKFVPGNVVPLVEGQAYGWIIGVRTMKKQVRWREEFTLPQAPKTWGDPEPLGTRKLSSDAKVSSTERVVEPVDGEIFNAWAVAEGDPPGQYKIRVFVEGKLVNTFEFEVR